MLHSMLDTLVDSITSIDAALAPSITAMESDLQILLQSCQKAHRLSIEDASLLARALTETDSDYRPLVFSILSLNLKDKTIPQESTPPVIAVLADFIQTSITGSDRKVIHAATLLEALFQLDGAIASKIVLDRDLLSPFIQDIAKLTFDSPLALVISSLISQACSDKTMREQIGIHCIPWLQRISSSQESNSELRINALNALIKLSYRQTPLVAGEEDPTMSGIVDLAIAMKEAFLRSTQPSHSNQAVEGLAYTSSHPKVKELFADDRTFLSSLLALVSEKSNGIASSLYYGVSLVMANLTATRPNLSEEEAQIRKLQSVASSGKSTGGARELETLEDQEHVRGRIKAVLQAGWLATLNRLSKLRCSSQMLMSLANAWINVIEHQEFRGFTLQAGATKSLLHIIQDASRELSSPSLEAASDETRLTAAQALAKLAITAPPLQVFGPDGSQAIDGLAALRQLLFHGSSSNLQIFESLMALTNLVTFNVEVATRIAQSEGLLEKIQGMFLDNNLMIRRASVELTCNLVGSSEAAFQEITNKPRRVLKNRLHVLIALSDVEDVATRLAASANLAMLSGEQTVSEALLSLHLEKESIVDILLHLLELPASDSETTNSARFYGLFVRGCTIMQNIVSNCAGRESFRAFLEKSKAKGLNERLRDGIRHPATEEAAEGLLKFLVSASNRNETKEGRTSDVDA
jgi:hypothetical protein